MATNVTTGNKQIPRRESPTSSKKSMHGEQVLARLNNVRTPSSLSPTNLFKSSGPYKSAKSIELYEYHYQLFRTISLKLINNIIYKVTKT